MADNSTPVGVFEFCYLLHALHGKRHLASS